MAKDSLSSLDSVLYQYVCSLEDGSVCDAIKHVYRIAWVFLVIGTVGNCLTLLVILQKTMRKMPTSVFWACLACADLSSLWMIVFAQTTLVETDEFIQSREPLLCVMSQWFMYTCVGLSVWLLVLLTFERLLCTLFPNSSRIKLTTRKAVITSAVTLVVLGLLNIHSIFGYTWAPGTSVCVYSSEGYELFQVTRRHSLGILILYGIVPTLVISAGNITIVCKLRDEARNEPATRTLFHVSCLFICSTLPYWLFLNIVQSLDPAILEEYKRHIQLVGAVIFVLLLGNFTLKFFLHCVNGTVFRKEFVKMIHAWRARCSPTAESKEEERTVSAAV